MTTQAQTKANRNNAKKSTGPRTEDGKARVAKNALKHGLLARDTVLPGEDPAEFDRQLSALEADIHPANSLEFELVRQIADAQWRPILLWRTLPACRVEIPLDVWGHSVTLVSVTYRKRPNKPNLAEPP